MISDKSMNVDVKKNISGAVKLVSRYVIAATMIPVGLLLGIGGAAQYQYRKAKNKIGPVNKSAINREEVEEFGNDKCES